MRSRRPSPSWSLGSASPETSDQPHPQPLPGAERGVIRCTSRIHEARLYSLMRHMGPNGRRTVSPPRVGEGLGVGLTKELNMTLAVGEQAPPFILRDATGRGEVKLEDFAGRPVVIAFYALAFTGG